MTTPDALREFADTQSGSSYMFGERAKRKFYEAADTIEQREREIARLTAQFLAAQENYVAFAQQVDQRVESLRAQLAEALSPKGAKPTAAR